MSIPPLWSTHPQSTTGAPWTLRRLPGSLSELPERWNYARDVVDRFAGETARPALQYRDASGQDHLYSFAEMSEGIHRFASVLESLCVGAGESLLVLLPPMPEWQFTVVGALAAAPDAKCDPSRLVHPVVVDLDLGPVVRKVSRRTLIAKV
jgi:hypothetical protein